MGDIEKDDSFDENVASLSAFAGSHIIKDLIHEENGLQKTITTSTIR